MQQMFIDFWSFMTNLGDPVIISFFIVWLLSLYYLLGWRHPSCERAKRDRAFLKKLLKLLLPSVVISLSATEMLKMIFLVPRACILCPAVSCNPFCLPSFSFPSGHAAAATAVAVSIYIISGRRWVSLPVFAFPVLNGISRLVLGVHTIIDVIGAFVLGLSVTLIVWRFRKSIYRWEDEKIF